MQDKEVTPLKMRMVEFAGYEEEDFVGYLSLQEAGELELEMPRRTMVYKSPPAAMAAEYARMALLGGKLAALGPGFSFWVPELNTRGSFIFWVPATDAVALAPLLVMAANLCAADTATMTPYDREAVALLHSYDGSDHPCYEICVLAFHFMMMGDRD